MKACPLLLLAFALALPLHAAPSDEDLLKFVKERAKLERLTPQPVDMAARVALLCGEPGKRSLKEGPHEGAKFVIYSNDAAALPVFDPWGKFPEGSLLLKEKQGREDDKTKLYTGMLKREAGYFPECGDWEFFTVDAEAAKITERGKLANCATCHEEYQKGDFVTKVYAAPVQLSGGRIVLHSSKAQVQGEKLQYEEKQEKNTLGFWVNPADWASWHFQVAKPGTYTIHVWQGCGKGSGGSEVELKCAGQSAKFTVEDTGGFQNFKEREVGQVTFDTAGPQALEVHALSKPGAAVMDLRQVTLVPVK
ncbi:cytochrome P460 family protein [Haloferula sp. BvORR071]|uniref:DUF5077 domain-containing protein n=1 Tax=Haloferula sp. BvORR071 TaxID=1396141 RepID=UPI002240EFD2|nr:cytochrome P460 family protein [Haloferula sp. BvORR071]